MSDVSVKVTMINDLSPADSSGQTRATKLTPSSANDKIKKIEWITLAH